MQSINLLEKQSISKTEIDDHTYHVQTRGYSVVPDFLSKQETQLIKISMMSAVDAYRPTEHNDRSVLDKYQIHDLINRDINYARLLEDARLEQLVAPHLGDFWIMYAATSSSIPPHGTNFSSRLHVDCPRFHPGYVFNIGLIWVLDDYTRENGALEVLPGSQHNPAVPSDTFFAENSTRILCEAGSLLIFNAKMYHRTGMNSTASWSHSMTLNACRSFMKQRLDWVRYIPDEISNQLNSQARRLVGFDTRLPTNMEEFFLPEGQRFYKPNQG